MNRSIFRSLSHRNFRLFFFGQSLSLVGTWTQMTAVQWLLSRLTENKVLYGFVGFAAQLPYLFLPPFAGVLSDRFDRRRLLIVTQSLAMLQAFALAALVATGHIQIWQVLVLNLILSLVNAFDLPTRQTFIGDMIENKDHLANAIALNATMVNGARSFGPSLAAAILVAFGEHGCFAINGLSFLAVLVALFAMRITTRPTVQQHAPYWAGFREGLSYVITSRPIRSTLFIVAILSLFGLPYSLLLPYFTRDTLDAGPWTYGILLSAPGCGALVAAVLIARKGLRGLTRRMMIAPIIAGAGLAGTSLCHTTGPAIVFLFATGFGFLLLLNSSNALLQSFADEDKRGRVMGFFFIAFTGMAPLGNLLIPSIAELFGTAGALQISSAVCVAAGLWFASRVHLWRPEVRARLLKYAQVELPVST